MKLNKYWFKPKRYGIGAFPITWEGYLSIIIFLTLAFTLAILFSKKEYLILFYSLLTPLVITLVIISKIKTKGKWKWGWG